MMNMRKALAPSLFLGVLALSACHSSQADNGTAANGTDMNAAGTSDMSGGSDMNASSMADNSGDMGNAGADMNASGNSGGMSNEATTNGSGGTR
jgi:hypothetical protein